MDSREGRLGPRMTSGKVLMKSGAVRLKWIGVGDVWVAVRKVSKVRMEKTMFNCDIITIFLWCSEIQEKSKCSNLTLRTET